MKTWDEILTAASQSGFITYSFGGVAILMCHEVQKEQGIFEATQWKAGLGKFPENQVELFENKVNNE